MNFLKVLLGLFAISAFFILSTTQFSACTKTKTEVEHDTTTVVKVDTLTKIDTFTVLDSTYDLQYGLVAYYNFNNGNLNDSSGYGNNITFNNATTITDRFGKANSAYLFNGTTNYMEVPNSTSLNPSNVTLMAIFKVNGFYTGPCHSNQLFGKGYPDYISGFYDLRFDDYSADCSTGPNVNIETFSGGVSSAGLIADTIFVKTGQWYNLIFTYDGNVSKIYLNGQLKGTSIVGPVSFTANNHDLFIGEHEDPAFPYYFNGVIDEIRIYNRALTGEAIKQLSK